MNESRWIVIEYLRRRSSVSGDEGRVPEAGEPYLAAGPSGLRGKPTPTPTPVDSRPRVAIERSMLEATPLPVLSRRARSFRARRRASAGRRGSGSALLGPRAAASLRRLGVGTRSSSLVFDAGELAHRGLQGSPGARQARAWRAQLCVCARVALPLRVAQRSVRAWSSAPWPHRRGGTMGQPPRSARCCMQLRAQQRAYWRAAEAPRQRQQMLTRPSRFDGRDNVSAGSSPASIPTYTRRAGITGRSRASSRVLF